MNFGLKDYKRKTSGQILQLNYQS